MRFRFLLLLLLCGCGKQPQEEAPRTRPQAAPPASQPPARDDRPVIVAFGDSLSAGFGADPGLSYPDFLQKEIDRAGYRYRVVNAGISGDTTAGGLSRIDTVTALHPEIVVLELGGNDGLRGLPLATTRSNLEQMIVALQKAGARVVLAGITLPPNYGADYIHALEKIYRDLAAAQKLPLIPFLLQEIYDKPGMMQADGIHPTAAGNKKVASLVMRTLRPLL